MIKKTRNWHNTDFFLKIKLQQEHFIGKIPNFLPSEQLIFNLCRDGKVHTPATN